MERKWPMGPHVGWIIKTPGGTNFDYQDSSIKNMGKYFSVYCSCLPSAAARNNKTKNKNAELFLQCDNLLIIYGQELSGYCINHIL